MKFFRLTLILAFIGLLGAVYSNLMSFPDGVVGYTQKTSTFGCGCHNLDPNDTVQVFIEGPAAVEADSTETYRLKIYRPFNVAGGTDIATSLGNLTLSPLDTSLKRDSTFQSGAYELTHRYTKLAMADTVSWTFQYTAPNTPGVVDTIFANGNAVNNDTTDEGDTWNYASKKLITVLNPSGIQGNNGIVNSFNLEQNFPNPFNPSTHIKFNLYKSGNVSLVLYDINGREISKLINNKFYFSGEATYVFDATNLNLNSGVYFYRLTANGGSQIKKMVLVK